MNKLAVIIVHFGYLKDTQDCLSALSGSRYKEFDIVIVDNSPSKSLKELENLPQNVVIIPSKANCGCCGGFNLGLNYIKDKHYEYTMLLNNDVIVDKNTLAVLIEALDIDADIVYPKIMNYPAVDTIQFAYAKADFKRSKFEIIGFNKSDYGQFNKRQESDIIGVAACIFKTELLEGQELFKENYFALHEDFELSYRLKRSGKKIVFIPDTKVWHKGGISHRKKDKAANYLAMRNKCLFINQYMGFPVRMSFYLGCIGELLKDLLKGKLYRGKLRGFIDGFLNFSGKPKWIKE